MYNIIIMFLRDELGDPVSVVWTLNNIVKYIIKYTILYRVKQPVVSVYVRQKNGRGGNIRNSYT